MKKTLLACALGVSSLSLATQGHAAEITLGLGGHVGLGNMSVKVLNEDFVRDGDGYLTTSSFGHPTFVGGFHLTGGVILSQSFTGSVYGDLTWAPFSVSETQADQGNAYFTSYTNIKAKRPNLGVGIQLGYRCGQITPYFGLGAVWKKFSILTKSGDGTAAATVVIEQKKSVTGIKPALGLEWDLNKSHNISIGGEFAVEVYSTKVFKNTLSSVSSLKIQPVNLTTTCFVRYKLGTKL